MKIQTFVAERGIYALVSSDPTLWAHLGEHIYEGGLPKGLVTVGGTFAVMREVDVPESQRWLTGEHIADTLIYDVVITEQDESYDGLMATDADLLFSVLDRAATSVDVYNVYVRVLGPVKRRYNRDGRIWKELGHRIAVYLHPTANTETAHAGHLQYFEWGAPSFGGGLGPYDISDKLIGLSVAVSGDPITTPGTTAVEWVFTLILPYEYVSNVGMLHFLTIMLQQSPQLSITYGPVGNAVGKPKWYVVGSAEAGGAYVRSVTQAHTETGALVGVVEVVNPGPLNLTVFL